MSRFSAHGEKDAKLTASYQVTYPSRGLFAYQITSKRSEKHVEYSMFQRMFHKFVFLSDKKQLTIVKVITGCRFV